MSLVSQKSPVRSTAFVNFCWQRFGLIWALPVITPLLLKMKIHHLPLLYIPSFILFHPSL